MLANRIKELRKQLKLSQRELADLLKVSQQTVASWETHRSEPSYDMMLHLATFFGVTLDDLLGRHDNQAPSQPSSSHDLQKFLQDHQGLLTYGGEELTEIEREQLRVAISTIFWKRPLHQ